MNWDYILPRKVKQLFQRLGITLLMMTLTRIIFLLSTLHYFKGVTFFDFLAGIWMDAITIGIYFIPFYFFSLLPLPFFNKKWYQTLLKVIFHITNSVIIALNLIDVEYFKFTSKRSTSDLFSMVSTGNDFNQLIGTFIVDFWWILFIFVVLFIISNWLYNKTLTKEKTKFLVIPEIIHFIVFSAILFIIGRGGFGYRPADMMTTSQFTKPSKVALVGNTPLSVIKTIGKATLDEKSYFPEESELLYNTKHKGTDQYQVREKPNIMVILLESFGNEWLGKKTGQPFTPFLDSLLDQSLYFDNAFANGKKSIEAVPAIFAGIPSLIKNPYISSPYGTNSIKALPQILQEKGYSSAFFHGATNGSMKFDDFSEQAGFDRYFGRTEYDNEAHCDATWGVLDEYFLPWTAETISKELKEPFLAGLFTLSSHHPYYVPPEYREILPEGEDPMAQSIAYADMSLRLFFETAKKQAWYDNTIFIISADHTPAGKSLRYTQHTGMYQIPIAIFDPQHDIKARVNHQVFNQIDILPTVLDMIGVKKDAFSFGKSFYQKDQPFSINYIGNSYVYFQDDYMINFTNDKTQYLYNYKQDTSMYYDSLGFYPKKAKQMERQLKGFIQKYNHDLIKNTMKLK